MEVGQSSTAALESIDTFPYADALPSFRCTCGDCNSVMEGDQHFGVENARVGLSVLKERALLELLIETITQWRLYADVDACCAIDSTAGAQRSPQCR